MLISLITSRFALNGINRWPTFNYPFKFNRSWLIDPDFNLWVAKRWPDINPHSSLNGLDNLSHKLKTLKGEVKAWTREKEKSMNSDSLRLDKDIESLLMGSFSGNFTHEDQFDLNHLRSKKKKLQEHLLLT